MKQAKKLTFFVTLAVILLVTWCAGFGLGDIPGAEDIRLGIDIRGGVNAVFTPAGLDRAPTPEEMDSARAVLETRLDAGNILDREVTVDYEQGQIIVNFPWKSGESSFDPESAIAELGEMAMLTFRDTAGNILMTGDAVARSYAATIESSVTPVVMLEFTEQGRKDFYAATEACVGSKMCIYMDDDMISDPGVSEAMNSDFAYIEGMVSPEAAQSLAEKINAGSLPFSLETTNHSTISPTLGQGALDVMLRAAAIAFAVVCVFMVLRYRVTGVIICIALVFQVAGQLLCLSIPQLTVTLPGIAGIILTVGMGVDAGIIIAARIAEELRRGYSVDRAVRVGFQHAMSAVIDGNVTSIIVAVILIAMGSGTILSFGYTLFFGIAFNLISGVVATRLMLTSLIRFRPFQNPRLFFRGKEPKIRPFCKNSRVAFLLSLVLIVAGVVACFVNGVQLDTSFTGGTVLRYTYTGELDEHEVERVAEAAVDRPASTQYTSDLATGEQKMVITFAGNDGMLPAEQESLRAALNDAFPDNGLELSESNVVAPYIGERTMRNSWIAIGLAAVLILVYVAIRFSVISGVSAGVTALIALVHDIAIVFFVFVLFRIPLNETYVAVTLTILGYSINGTIVNYDRVRENRKLFHKSSTQELVDLSVSQCFSRSLWSTATTFTCTAIMYVFALLYGLSAIQVFALPMAIGLLSGFFSSTCLAGPLWVRWQAFKARRSA